MTKLILTLYMPLVFYAAFLSVAPGGFDAAVATKGKGGVLAEIAMVLGYYVFEGFLYGFGPSLVNIPANAVQGVAGVVIGMILITLFEKQNVLKMLK